MPRRMPTVDSGSEVQRWLTDLVRIGAAGNAAGVRQLANRLAKEVPTVVTDVDSFRAAVGEALSEAAAASVRTGSPLRDRTKEVVPQDLDTALPVAIAEEGVEPEVPVLAKDVALKVDALVRERNESARLYAAGLEPSSKVLLSGPPGVGKTMTARSLAHRLGLPLLAIDLATVMSSYLGRTGQNLRAALNHGRSAPSVVLLDEFDALAKRRDDNSDIGELKRLVNVLLLELERWPTSSLLVAATNHPQLLDGAVQRRFDVVIEMELPDEAQREAILRSTWIGGQVDPSIIGAVASAADGASGSDLVSAALAAAKNSVLTDEHPDVSLIREVSYRSGFGPGARDRLVALIHATSDLSNRELATLFGVSHPTIGSALKRTKSARRSA